MIHMTHRRNKATTVTESVRVCVQCGQHPAMGGDTLPVIYDICRPCWLKWRKEEMGAPLTFGEASAETTTKTRKARTKGE